MSGKRFGRLEQCEPFAPWSLTVAIDERFEFAEIRSCGWQECPWSLDASGRDLRKLCATGSSEWFVRNTHSGRRCAGPNDRASHPRASLLRGLRVAVPGGSA